MTSHIEAAERYLAGAVTEAVLVDDLPEEKANSYVGRRARYRAGVDLKAAEVHALLAVAEQLEGRKS